MPAPKRPRKKKTEEVTTTKQSEVTEVMTDGESEKDALIKELQAQVLSQEEHEKQIKKLQEQLAKAEAEVESANKSTEDFKLKPDPDDKEKFYYFEIIWHPKRSDSDEEFVTLGVNGKLMVWARNKPAVIRSDYLEVCENAFVPRFKQLPGEERKEIGGLKPYTYTINRKITQEEYDRRKKEGDKALHEDLASKGISL